jgi:galactose oxidase-like protein
MAYDSARGRVLLFGGEGTSGAFFNDTWEWDGESWTQVADIGPTPRTMATMACDESRGRVVLFGGYGAGRPRPRDTWEWDGEAWTQMADTGPSSRTGHAVAGDQKRKHVVLFGGSAFLDPGQDPGPQGDTWVWTGDVWTKVEDTGPSARASHAMAYDPTRERTVLLGGVDSSTGNILGDTWEWDGNLWTHRTDIGPGGMVGHAMVFNGRFVETFGGRGVTGELLGNTWEWDGKHWTARQDMGPSPRTAFSLAYDSKRDRVVLFGGSTADGVHNDLWEQFQYTV